MTRPAPTVTVPVEPTEADVSHAIARLRTLQLHAADRTPRISKEQRQALHDDLKTVLDALAAAAPAAPQAAGVGEATDDDAIRYISDWCPDHVKDYIDRLRAPSREPEGGAVSEGELRDAIALILPLAKGYAAAHPVGSNQAYVDYVENLIAAREEAPADPCASHKAEGLALDPCCPTCEAPAEAGEATQTENPGGYLIRDFADGWIWTPHRIAAVAALTDGHAVYDLRAQPQAREDYSSLIAARCLALPGKLIDCPVCGAVDNERDRQAREDAQPGASEPPPPTSQQFRKNPAPDALRVAVEALEPFAAMARVIEARDRMALGKVRSDNEMIASASWEGGLAVLTMGHLRDALTLAPNAKGWGGLYRRSPALAALQAEQGAK